MRTCPNDPRNALAEGIYEDAKTLGRIFLVDSILFIAFNLRIHYVLLTEMNILGLIERCIFYLFDSQTFKISWHYTFRRNRSWPSQLKKYCYLLVLSHIIAARIEFS